MSHRTAKTLRFRPEGLGLSIYSQTVQIVYSSGIVSSLALHGRSQMAARTTLNRFVEACPLVVMSRVILDAVINEDLDAVFDEHRQRGYHRQLLYSHLTRTIAQVVLGVCKTPNQAFNKLAETIAVSKTAFYEKLKRVEPDVCRASVQYSYQRCLQMMSLLKTKRRTILSGYRCRMIDGNHLEGCDNRLKELRKTWARALPGTAVVIHDPQWNLVEDIFLIPNAHAQERTIFTDILETVERKDLIVADSHYCTIGFLTGISARNACFVIRQHGSLKGTLVSTRKSRGRTKTGQVYEQQLIIDQATGATVRRITVELDQPTQSGDTEIHILTNLPERKASAARVAEIYLLRHEIEHVFYLSTTTLTCEVKGLNYPMAALFLFCTAMIAINCRFVLFAALAAAHGRAVCETISHHSAAQEICEGCDGLHIAIPDDEWQSLLPKAAAARTDFLIEVAQHLNLRRHTKTVRGPKKPPPRKTPFKNGTHVAVQKILDERN